MTSSFSLSDIEEELSQESLALRRRPLIGVTGNFEDNRLSLFPGYYRSLEAVGANVVVIPPRRKPDAALLSLLERLDGLLLSGGSDLNPLFVGEEPTPALHAINSERDAFELALIRQAYHLQIPIFGICRGIQLLAAALGGTIYQDLHTALPDKCILKHSQEASRGTATHTVKTVEGSLLRRLFGEKLTVNSFHHQAVNTPGPNFRTTATSADGVTEAIETIEGVDKHWIVGVQWHPECFILEGDEKMLPLFREFVSASASYRRARTAHAHILTLDSHCDTPMFFEKGVELTHRDPQLLVDLPKMREGGLDSTVMVAYIPQGKLDELSHQAAFTKADKLLDEVKTRIDRARGVKIAYTPSDLYRNKAEGFLSVMLGIENGYAIGDDLSRLSYFREKGIIYMTLCHNGDNLICDSAKNSKNTSGGLSDFGRKAISEMNRLGIMVDLSHAAESSFYDAIDTSKTPIICSHSSARELCNHPRNLSDDQLRAIAKTDGVAQATLYAGFLRSENNGKEATIDDAVAHILHMINIAGINHVGIGTDFDGDGGVPGLSSASQIINLTRHLQAEGLTTEELSKIWSGNFLRVMNRCLDYAENIKI